MRPILIFVVALTLLFAFSPMATPSNIGTDSEQSIHDADAVACRPLRAIFRGLSRGFGRARAGSC